MAAPGRATDQTGVSDPSIVRFRALVEAGLAALEARREEVNDLNVFPVADGDTGDNMAMTLRAVMDELDRIDEQGVDDVLVTVGGTIPAEDIPELKRLGVSEVFTPGAPTQAIVDFIRAERESDPPSRASSA